ncbi:VOC family protein [Paenibacillus tarimensis]|uniref:VOC family protein n=1 Tax=Paenibacillus tarimensis TaxID=416012 RepID=UPI001F1835A2|nr:VOC family protein [Paenibacillus tarimensis]MCF2946063.1 VOC family protein [Paenibacillus tarimensis]
MKVESLDHIVLTVANIEKSIAFYTGLLGMKEVTFGGGRKALAFGDQKINLHEHGKEFEPKALSPRPGSADLCFVTGTPVEQYADFLSSHGVVIEEGPVSRTGAKGSIRSIYLRDPDGNLLELSNYE